MLKRRSILLLSIGLLVAMPACASAQQITGRVVSIADGDTLTVLDGQNTQHRIRLAEIDAPEVGHGAKKPGQPYGTNSKQALADMCFKQVARVDVVDVDQYGRIVGRVECSGRDVNLEQVRAGMAWAYRQYARRPEIFSAEQGAKSARKGLWSDTQPTPPWAWRRKGG